MRIISGKYGGRLLSPPKKFRARPTTDLAKEGLFNILANQIDFRELQVLDLFAGTGSIGLEFLSRGARHVDFVEMNYYHVRFIQGILHEWNISNARVMRANALTIIEKLSTNYDIIFADPPYDHPDFKTIPEKILQTNLLDQSGHFILEHPKNYSFNTLPDFYSQRNYGSVNFSFFSPS